MKTEMCRACKKRVKRAVINKADVKRAALKCVVAQSCMKTEMCRACKKRVKRAVISKADLKRACKLGSKAEIHASLTNTQ